MLAINIFRMWLWLWKLGLTLVHTNFLFRLFTGGTLAAPVKMELHCFSRDASPIEYNFLLEICTNGFVTSAHIVRLCWGPFNGLHSRSDSRFPDGERNRGIPLEKLCKISSQVHFGSLGTPYNGFHRHLVDTLYWARVWDAVGRRWVSPERFRGQSWEARCLWWGVCRWPSWHTASSSWRQIYFPGVVMGVTLITWQHNKCHRSHYHLIHSLPARWFRIFMMTT